MPNLLNQFAELISLTNLYLLREFHSPDPIFTDPSTHLFYQPYQKTPPHETSKPLHTPPPPYRETSLPRQDINKTVQVPLPTKTQIIPPEVSLQQHQQESELENLKLKNTPSSFHLEPLSGLEHTSQWNDFKPLFQQYFPNHPLNEQIPSDARAKKINTTWKMDQVIPPVVILSFNDQNNQLVLIKNIAKATSLNLAPTRVISAHTIEQQNKWKEFLHSPSLKLIIASDYGFYLLPELMKFYKEVPKSAKHFLHQTPLLLLSDLSLYLKEPQLKSLLWRAICSEFQQKTS